MLEALEQAGFDPSPASLRKMAIPHNRVGRVPSLAGLAVGGPTQPGAPPESVPLTLAVPLAVLSWLLVYLVRSSYLALFSPYLIPYLAPDWRCWSQLSLTFAYGPAHHRLLCPTLAPFRPQIKAYLEVHIEQGPVLQAVGRRLGTVAAIAGQSRLQAEIIGEQVSLAFWLV